VQKTSTIQNLAILNDLNAGGGVERVLSQLVADVFPEDRPTIFLYQPPGVDCAFRAQAVALDVAVPPYEGFVQEVRSVWKAWFSLRREKRSRHIKVCVSHKEGPNFANVLSGVSKTIVTVHEPKSSGIKFRGFKRTLTGILMRVLYNRADVVVTVSKGIADDLVRNFGIKQGRIRTITNPCDVTAIQELSRLPPPAGLERDPTRPTLISVGRLETPKGQWHLIRAFTRIQAAIPRARLIVAGTGDHLAYLQKLVTELKLRDSVVFTGFVKNPYALMASADLFVLSSLWEGFPLVLAEAMACGLVVVATDCPTGAREILAPQSQAACGSAIAPELAEFGVLTPVLDGRYYEAADALSAAEETLAQACVQVLNDPQLREHYVQRGAARIQDFSLAAYRTKWRELVSSL
jgi:glycosyltransferase involved in cell wall biosynthesis